MKTTIKYIQGDATNIVINPKDTTRLIIHVCNDIGAWGAGFVMAVSKRWPEPEQAYRSFNDYVLGSNQYVLVDAANNIHVVNMISQHGIGRKKKQYIDYDALKSCLTDIKTKFGMNNISLHMPRIGCGLAGGSWDVVEAIILSVFDNNYDIYVYDLIEKN